MIGESSNAVGLIPGGMVRRGDRAAGEDKGVVEARKSAVLILAALELKPLLSAMLLFSGKPGTNISSPPLLLSLLLLLLLSSSILVGGLVR